MNLVEGPAVAPSFAQGMARWLGWTDAIALSGALHAPMSGPATPQGGMGSPTAQALASADQAMARVQASVLRVLERDMPTDEADFAPYRRQMVAVQRVMEDAIGPLRAQVRAALTRGTPELARLAAIDAVMENVLGPREHALLAMMPTLLDRHFEHLRGGMAEPGAAARAFRQDLRHVLLAELDLRLQPVLGLVEALRTTQQG